MKYLLSLICIAQSFIVSGQIYTSEIEVTNSTNGKVGIGVTNPSEMLHVNGSGQLGNLFIGNWIGNTGYVVFTHELLKSNSLSYALLQHSGGETYLNAASGKNLYFRNNNVTHMLLQSDGNIGIGNSNPQSKLEIYEPTVYYNGYDANQLILRAPMTGGTNDGRMVGFTMTFDSYDRMHNSGQKSAGIYAVSNSSWANAVGLLFYTRHYSGSPFFAERMRIKSSGEVGIGTTTPSYKLDVNGTARVTSLIQTSDERLKQDVRTVSDLSGLRAINSYQYRIKEDAYTNLVTTDSLGNTIRPQFLDKDHIGLMAQEVEQYFPDLVYTDEQGYKAIDYSQFIPILIESYKAQQSELDALKQEMQTLKELINNK